MNTSAPRGRFGTGTLVLIAVAVGGFVCSTGGARLEAQATFPEVRVDFLYTLSDFNGPIPYSDVVLHVDRKRDEVYAMVGNSVRVFGSTGLEIFRFDHNPLEFTIFDLAVEDDGEILLLTYGPDQVDGRLPWWITRCDYKGDEIDRIFLEDLPEGLEDFTPNRLLLHDELLIMVSRQEMIAVTVESDGRFVASYDLGALGLVEEADEQEISDFDVDPHGNFLFTIATLFKAYVVAPDGTSRQFGSAGSVPGRFGIVSGIVGDDHGNILIADKLRGVVMVFGPNLLFITEFGTAGSENLARPSDLAMGVGGKFYVTQVRERGVAAYRLTPLAPRESPAAASVEEGSASPR